MSALLTSTSQACSSPGITTAVRHYEGAMLQLSALPTAVVGVALGAASAQACRLSDLTDMLVHAHASTALEMSKECAHLNFECMQVKPSS